ncbi:unnamed protein product [Didymodactylos carnosus]|uniref:Uncharacterized protein n=1 Tax=Didymodactylos carnosus TaxID=1234261 RepID=A0A8S2FJ55_9BILA|nr:unnamed protein product [Didymodactylos carnosus]CAF4272898.1 unnamed protein product [Didymodactylos carnosus]
MSRLHRDYETVYIKLLKMSGKIANNSTDATSKLWKTDHSIPGRPIFGAQYSPLSLKSNKKSVPNKNHVKEQQAFTEYMNNTVDAWTIDDELESENEENDIDKEEPFISKQVY